MRQSVYVSLAIRKRRPGANLAPGGNDFEPISRLTGVRVFAVRTL